MRHTQAHIKIEGTYIQINNGTINVTGTDVGLNEANKSSAYETAIDSSGNLCMTGGTVNITVSGAFDYDGTATRTGGTIIANGQTLSDSNGINTAPAAPSESEPRGGFVMEWNQRGGISTAGR